MERKLSNYIGNELKSLRARHGLKLSELSKNTGITTQILSQYENNKVNISVNRLERLLEYYNIDLNIFFRNLSEYSHLKQRKETNN